MTGRRPAARWWLAVALPGCLLLAAGGCLRPGAYLEGGGRFVELADAATRTCTEARTGEVLGRRVTVHYPPHLAPGVPERFFRALRAWREEVERDYAGLRAGIRYHLGDDLYERVREASYLQPPPFYADWYLVPDPGKAWRWRMPGAGFVLLPPGDPDPPGEALRPPNALDAGPGVAGQVHEIVHWLIRDIVTSRRGCLPRWLEEGLADYAQMQFRRWKHGSWDGDRAVEARLFWARPEYRRRAFRYRDGSRGPLDALITWRYPAWTGDIVYRASLGLVVGLDDQLGTFAFKDLLRDLLLSSPETDEEVIRIIEHHAGMPIDRVGLLPPAAREELYRQVLARARQACEDPGDPPLFLGPRILGLFPEHEDEALPVLLELTRCPRAAVIEEGLAGLRLLGRRRLLRAMLERVRRDVPAPVLRELEERWHMEVEFSRDHRRAARWFGRARETGIPPAARPFLAPRLAGRAPSPASAGGPSGT